MLSLEVRRWRYKRHARVDVRARSGTARGLASRGLCAPRLFAFPARANDISGCHAARRDFVVSCEQIGANTSLELAVYLIQDLQRRCNFIMADTGADKAKVTLYWYVGVQPGVISSLTY